MRRLVILAALWGVHCPAFDGTVFACETAADCSLARCEQGRCVPLDLPDAAPERDGGSPDACVPMTCAELGCSDAPVENGCGGLLRCPRCTALCATSEYFDRALDPSVWKLGGAAELFSAAGFVRLVSKADDNEGGTLVRSATISSEAFSFEASFRLSPGPLRPDGIAFGWFEPSSLDEYPQGFASVGGGGGYVGYRGYVIEVDYSETRDIWDDTESPSIGWSYVTGELDDQLPARSIRHVKSATISIPDLGTHVLNVTVNEDRLTAWLDDRLVFDATDPDYVFPYDAKFTVAAANGGYIGDADLLELHLRCGPASVTDFMAGYQKRRNLRLIGDPGTTVRLALGPATIGPDNEPSVAIYQGRRVIRAQWEDPATFGDARPALVVTVPGASSDPTYLYYDDPRATSKLSDRTFAITQRFDGPRDPLTWRDEWRAVGCADRLTGSAQQSACVDDDGRDARTLAPPPATTLRGQQVELAFHVSGGAARPSDVLTIATAANSADRPEPVLISPDAYGVAGPRPDTTSTTPLGQGVVGVTPTVAWQRYSARFTWPVDHTTLHFRLLSPDTTTSTTNILLDDVTVRRLGGRLGELGEEEGL